MGKVAPVYYRRCGDFLRRQSLRTRPNLPFGTRDLRVDDCARGWVYDPAVEELEESAGDAFRHHHHAEQRPEEQNVNFPFKQG